MEPCCVKAISPSPDGDLCRSSPEVPLQPEPDLLVRTSGGLRIPVHSSVLASVSPVLDNIIHKPRKHRSSERVVPILGVPCEAVAAFIGFLYRSRCSGEEMEKFGIHLLALSHVYSVPHLKQRCTKELGLRLTIDNVVDVLQLARMCDAPDLYLKCMKLVYSNFKSIEETEGWKFVSYHDPWLELEILQFIDEKELRKRKMRSYREEQRLYFELSEAMDCLEHIFTEGCTTVGPHDVEVTTVHKKRGPCTKSATCQGLQLLIRHFAGCKNRINGGGCSRCKRMWQLLRLHSSICDKPDSCRVPLCRQSKLRPQQEKKRRRRGEDARWKLLVKKVVAAKVMSSLSQSKRKRAEDASDTAIVHGMRNFRL